VLDWLIVIEAPDVDENLVPWSAVELRSGFEIEDVLVEADLAGVSAAGGRVARSRLARVSLAGARLRSLRLVDAVLSDAEALLH